MCGINGFVSNINCKNTQTIISSMNSCIVHRGPDDFGVFVENVNTNSVAMSMRRLSIIDLKQGKQPIYSDDKNLVIVFNGEIYNYLNLKNHLKKKFNTTFHTNSDTEVILKLYEVYNTKGFSMLDGMFAFSIFDKKLNKIFIARDFFGEKPLHYFLDKNKFYWASELKSIAKVIDKRPKICKRGLSLYFQLTYIPAPYTIYKNINKLEANHYLEFDTEKFNFTINKIRKLENLTSSSNISFKNAKKITFDLVMESVKSRSVSDVKVGAFLSGGVDSSIISLCHSLNQKNKIDTFSLGFKNKSYDESNKFRTISNHLNSNHNEIFVDLKDNVFDIDRLLLNYDEPFADSSAIPTFLISKYTSNKVKVVLSGDYELKSILISEEAKKENQEIINDLIIAAFNNAKENLKKKSSEEISKITGGINLPFDIKFPS